MMHVTSLSSRVLAGWVHARAGLTPQSGVPCCKQGLGGTAISRWWGWLSCSGGSSGSIRRRQARPAVQPNQGQRREWWRQQSCAPMISTSRVVRCGGARMGGPRGSTGRQGAPQHPAAGRVTTNRCWELPTAARWFGICFRHPFTAATCADTAPQSSAAALWARAQGEQVPQPAPGAPSCPK